METLNDNEVKPFHDDLEKCYDQVELVNQKGDLLLQSSAMNLNDDNENKIERSLETINRLCDSLTINTKAHLARISNIQQPTESTTAPITTNTITSGIKEEVSKTLFYIFEKQNIVYLFRFHLK